MNVKQLARLGAKAELDRLLREIRALARMFPGLADENPTLGPTPRKGGTHSPVKKKGKKTRRQYTDKYKADAVAEAKARKVGPTARRLGIAPSVLRYWVIEAGKK